MPILKINVAFIQRAQKQTKRRRVMRTSNALETDWSTPRVLLSMTER